MPLSFRLKWNYNLTLHRSLDILAEEDKVRAGLLIHLWVGFVNFLDQFDLTTASFES